jgi:hypothetical protein
LKKIEMLRLRRSLSTAATPVSPKRSRLALYLAGTTLTISSIYLGTAFYASINPKFNEYFIQTPGSSNALLLVDILKSPKDSTIYKTAEDSILIVGKTVDTVVKSASDIASTAREGAKKVGESVIWAGESVGGGVKKIGESVGRGIEIAGPVYKQGAEAVSSVLLFFLYYFE